MKKCWGQYIYLATLLMSFAGVQTSATADFLDWTGSLSNNWFSVPNWHNLQGEDRVPTSSDDVQIPSAPSRQPIIDNPTGQAKADFLGVNIGAELNHTRGTLTVYANMSVAGDVIFNLGVSANSATLVNNASHVGENAITIQAGGSFANWGGNHFGNTGKKMTVYGTYSLNAVGGTLDFHKIEVKGSNGLLDWNAGTLTTDEILLKDSGKWAISGNKSYGATLTIQDSAEIEIRDGGANLGTLTLPSSSFYGYDGTIDGNLVTDNFFSLYGTVDVLGDYSQDSAGGTFIVEVDTVASYGSLDVAGDANLSGLVMISDTYNYYETASDGDSFTILTAANIIGSFEIFSDACVFENSELACGRVYPSSGDSVLVNIGLIGDLNDDGFVGISDLNIVLSTWNSNVTAGVWDEGDPTGDGFVGIEDLNTVLGNWNAGTPPIATVEVPEPTCLALRGMAAFGLPARRRRPRTQ